MEHVSRIGMDTSKHIFQIHGVDAAERSVLRKKLRREDMVTFFEKLDPTVIAIEACGASHHWARLLQSFGHEVKLIAPQLVKPYVKRDKSRDASPVLEAAEHALNQVALTIRVLVERMRPLAYRIVGDHRHSASLTRKRRSPSLSYAASPAKLRPGGQH
jgi:transposase